MDNLIRRNSLFYGALLMTASSIGLRVVQMIFQIYISGVMGATGLGRMQLILTAGTFATILASGGVRIAATCLASEEAGMERAGGVRTAIRCCMLYGLSLSLLVSCLMLLGADLISRMLLPETDGALALRIYACSIPVTVLWSVLSGYYTAAGRITELVGLEFFERILSILLVVFGVKTDFLGLDPCEIIFLSSGVATGISLLIQLVRYRRIVSGIRCLPLLPMMKRLIKMALPLGVNDVLRSSLSTIENMLVPRGLQRGGASGETALAAYGTICGMVFPVITFPSVILYSLSDLLVPEMARSRAKERTQRIITLTERCLRLSVIFAIGTGGLCFLLGDKLGELFFGSSDAGIYIRIFSPLIPMLYLDAITDGILKGLSQQLHTVRYNTITSTMDVLLLFLLLPTYGISGFIAAYTISHGVNFFLSLRRLILVTGYLPSFRTTIRAALCCVVILFICQGIFPFSMPLIPQVILSGIVFLLGYGLMTMLLGALKTEDVRWIKKLILRQ